MLCSNSVLQYYSLKYHSHHATYHALRSMIRRELCYSTCLTTEQFEVKGHIMVRADFQLLALIRWRGYVTTSGSLNGSLNYAFTETVLSICLSCLSPLRVKVGLRPAVFVQEPSTETEGPAAGLAEQWSPWRLCVFWRSAGSGGWWCSQARPHCSEAGDRESIPWRLDPPQPLALQPGEELQISARFVTSSVHYLIQRKISNHYKSS